MPAHISESHVDSHIFTVEEIAAMHGNDLVKALLGIDLRSDELTSAGFARK